VVLEEDAYTQERALIFNKRLLDLLMNSPINSH
jgi:hypothetical protein